MTSSRRFDRLLQAGCLGLIGTLAVAGCGGSSSGPTKVDAFSPDVIQSDGGSGPGAALTVTPPSVDFGAIDVGAKSAPITVTVANAGTVTSGPLGVTVSGTGITATGCSGTTLAPKATCTITVTAQAAVAGAISGSIEVGDTAATTKKISVSGIAVVPGQFSLAPMPLDLGPVVAGKSATATVVMTNTAQTGLTGIVINISGTGFTAGTGTCTESLGVGQTCNIVVNFTAGATGGIAKGTLTVSQGGVTKPVALTATVQAPAKLVMTPASASLQTVLGTASQPVTFYVTNAGDVTSAIPAVTITGAQKDDFSQTNSCATALPGGATASCQITVIYNPKAAPATSSLATLTVAEPGTAGSSATASLTGTAVPPSDLVITGPATPDFGSVVVGTTSTALTFTVTNTGGDDSGVVKVSTAAPFAIATDNCSDKNLAAKATCTFTAQFKPVDGNSGVVQGQLKAVGASVANPALFSVTGSAVPAAKLAINPKSLEFGALPTYQESTPQTLVVSNSGAAPTGVLKVENTGAQFKIKGDTCTGATLSLTGATPTCSIIVTFTSTGTDVEATGNIVVTDTTGAAGTATASLHGVGTSHAGLAMDPSVVCPQYTADDPLCRQSAVVTSLGIFKNRVVGQKTDELSVRITNNTPPTQAPDSGVISLNITGDASGDFAIVQNNCTTLLSTYNGNPNSGTSCLVTLTFTPSAVGLRKATLVLSTTRGGASQTTLEGKGLPAFELQPLQVTSEKDGLTFGQASLGYLDSKQILPYRVWVRASTAADKTSTVTLTLPSASPADFVWAGGTLDIGGKGNLLTPPVPDGTDICVPAVGGSTPTPAVTCSKDAAFGEINSVKVTVDDSGNRTNPCHSKTVSLAIPTGATEPVLPSGWHFDKSSGYAYCNFAVQFYPNSARGNLTAEVNGNGTNSGTAKLTLNGQAVGPITIGPSPFVVSDPVAIGQTKTTGLTLTVTNNGGVTQTGLTFELSGTGAGDFQIEGTTCWTKKALVGHALGDPNDPTSADLFPKVKIDELASGEKCLVWLGFKPQTEAAYAVNLTVRAANGAGATDDETSTAIIRTTGLKTYGALTVSPNPVTLADTPFNKEDAAPVVITITNNGSLDTGLVTATVGDNFEIVKEAGTTGVCNTSGTWRVPGSQSCTIKLRAKPTAVPAGIGKQLITGTLVVTDTAVGGSVVKVPLTYYETSNLMVSEVGGTASSTVTYGFPAMGQNVADTKRFTVTNVSSQSVQLKLQTVAQFSVLQADISGLTVCKDLQNLNAGQSCTLVISDSHPTVGVDGINTDITMDVKDNVQAANFARIYLSSITVASSILRPYGLSAENAAGTDRISLGSVPFGSTMVSGGLILTYRNNGDIKTGTLSYVWNEGASDPAITGYVPQDEFSVVASEVGTDCLAGTKQLGPKEFCTIKVQFKPKAGNPAGTRTATLTLIDGEKVADNAQKVTLTAHAVNPATTIYAEVSSTQGFYQFPGNTASGLTAGNGASRSFVLHKPSAEAPTLLFTAGGPFARKAVTGTNECPTGTWAAGTTTCEFTIEFLPTSSAQVFNYDEVVLATGVTVGLMGRVTQPAQLQYIAPVGNPLLRALSTSNTPPDAENRPEGLDMLKIVTGGSSPDYTLTVVNIGDLATTPLDRGTIDALAAGTHPVFTVSEGCLGKNLGAYGSATDRCTVTVKATAGTQVFADPVRTSLKFKGTGATAPVAEKAFDLGVRVANAAKLYVYGTGTFGDTAVTGWSEQEFQIRNEGVGKALNAARSGKIDVTLGGSNAAHFQLVGNTCPPNTGLPSYDGTDATTIANTTCKVTVRFMPTALSPSTDAFTATLNVAATPGSADAFALIGMPKSSLSIPAASGTPLTVTVPAGTSAATVLTVVNDGSADQTKPIKTSLSNPTEFMLIDDQCYGTMLAGGANCIVEVKYIGATTNTAKTTTLTVDGGIPGQSVTVTVSYTGAAATTH